MAIDFSIAQLVGMISFAIGIAVFCQKDDRRFKILMVVLQLNHVLHFVLLGSLVSAMSALISAVRTVTAIYVSTKLVAAVFICFGLATGIWLADSLWDLWPIFGTVAGTYSIFMLSGIRMRIGFLIGSGCWLINNITVGSIGGTLLEITMICVNVMTIYRLNREQNQILVIDN